MRYLWNILIPIMLFSPVVPWADTLLIDSVKKTTDDAKARSAPTRGMTMSQVEQKLGVPNNKLAAVGAPPITRWIYADYTVYFEHQLVITSVIKR